MRLLKDNICPFLGNLFPFSTIPLSMWFNVRVLHDICVWAEGTLVADVLIVLRQPPHSLRFPSRQILFMGAEKYTSPEEGNTKVWPTCPACWSPVLVSHGSPTSASICHLCPPPLPREAPPSSLEGSFSFQAVARESRMDEIWRKKIQILDDEEIWLGKIQKYSGRLKAVLPSIIHRRANSCRQPPPWLPRALTAINNLHGSAFVQYKVFRICILCSFKACPNM